MGCDCTTPGAEANTPRGGKAAGLIGDDHVVGEIGQVLDGQLEGRQSADQVTIYKSLGHVVQDLAAAQALYDT